MLEGKLNLLFLNLDIFLLTLSNRILGNQKDSDETSLFYLKAPNDTSFFQKYQPLANVSNHSTTQAYWVWHLAIVRFINILMRWADKMQICVRWKSSARLRKEEPWRSSRLAIVTAAIQINQLYGSMQVDCWIYSDSLLKHIYQTN